MKLETWCATGSLLDLVTSSLQRELFINFVKGGVSQVVSLETKRVLKTMGGDMDTVSRKSPKQ